MSGEGTWRIWWATLAGTQLYLVGIVALGCAVSNSAPGDETGGAPPDDAAVVDSGGELDATVVDADTREPGLCFRLPECGPEVTDFFLQRFQERAPCFSGQFSWNGTAFEAWGEYRCPTPLDWPERDPASGDGWLSIYGDLYGFDEPCQFFLQVEGGSTGEIEIVRQAARACGASSAPYSVRFEESAIALVDWDTPEHEACLLEALQGTDFSCMLNLEYCDTVDPDVWPEPRVRCVDERGPGDYVALFTYTSTFDSAVPVGQRNQFSPGELTRGQPTRFRADGTVLDEDRIFGVSFDGEPLTWTLAGRSATASAESPPCSAAKCPDQCGLTDCDGCADGLECVDGMCVTLCGDGLCTEGGYCAEDCACYEGEVCYMQTCGRSARCGTEWECGSGISFGNAVDCGECPEGLTCNGHVCR